MKTTHSVWFVPVSGDERLIATCEFRGSFAPAAYKWFSQIVNHHIGCSQVPVFYKRVNDKTLAGWHYVANGDVYELR